MKKSNASENDSKSRLDFLYEEIVKHNKKYHQENNPSISDAEYDDLVREALEIEKKFPNLKKIDSPTDLVGAEPVEGFKKIKHQIPMLSIQNAKNISDVNSWVDGLRNFLLLNDEEEIEFIAEPKIDGLSATLLYKKGELILGATRGDGNFGEDVTENLRTIIDIPQYLEKKIAPDILEVRGEVPLNLKFFYEGEEEIGSVHLGPWVEKNKKLLEADGMHCLDGTVDTFAKVPEVELGLKSVLFIELIARQGNKDIHSLNFPLVPSPPWELVHALSTICLLYTSPSPRD